MASLLTGSCKFLAFSSVMLSLLFLTVVMSVEFEVGGKDGWAIPDSKNGQLYDHWASNNRFNVNDTLRMISSFYPPIMDLVCISSSSSYFYAKWEPKFKFIS